MPETVQELFDELPQRFEPQAWGQQDAVLAFTITGEQGGNWVVDIHDQQMDVREGTADDADLTLTSTDEDLMAMVKGDLNPVTAFMQGRVKIKGDMSLAMKLQTLLSEMR